MSSKATKSHDNGGILPFVPTHEEIERMPPFKAIPAVPDLDPDHTKTLPQIREGWDYKASLYVERSQGEAGFQNLMCEMEPGACPGKVLTFAQFKAALTKGAGEILRERPGYVVLNLFDDGVVEVGQFVPAQR